MERISLSSLSHENFETGNTLETSSCEVEARKANDFAELQHSESRKQSQVTSYDNKQSRSRRTKRKREKKNRGRTVRVEVSGQTRQTLNTVREKIGVRSLEMVTYFMMLLCRQDIVSLIKDFNSRVKSITSYSETTTNGFNTENLSQTTDTQTQKPPLNALASVIPLSFSIPNDQPGMKALGINAPIQDFSVNPQELMRSDSPLMKGLDINVLNQFQDEAGFYRINPELQQMNSMRGTHEGRNSPVQSYKGNPDYGYILENTPSINALGSMTNMNPNYTCESLQNGYLSHQNHQLNPFENALSNCFVSAMPNGASNGESLNNIIQAKHQGGGYLSHQVLNSFENVPSNYVLSIMNDLISTYNFDGSWTNAFGNMNNMASNYDATTLQGESSNQGALQGDSSNKGASGLLGGSRFPNI